MGSRGDAYTAVPPAPRETFEAIRRALADGFFRPAVPYWLRGATR